MAPNLDKTANTPLFGQVFLKLKPHMARLDHLLAEQVASFEPEIRKMADYCIDTSGKRIRPSLVFLSGMRDEAIIDADLVKAAAVVELVHLATLVHDDIMDAADVRRNRDTAVKTYGSAAAVLLGDALFAHALHLASTFPSTFVCYAVSESTRKVCGGEIIQTMRRGTASVSLEDYYRVIDLKTAELFRVSCELGAKLAGYSDELVLASAAFGRHLGIAYQIYDDLADFFGQESRIGKTLGTDLASGKLTLPLFVLRDRLDASGQRDLMDEICGIKSPHLQERLEQMRSLGVFDVVEKAIQDELQRGAAVMAPFMDHLSSRLLGSLSELLITQVAALRPR